jgi:hypothetical protein
VQFDRLEHGPQLVVTIGPDAQHAKVEIHFRVRSDREFEAFRHGDDRI